MYVYTHRRKFSLFAWLLVVSARSKLLIAETEKRWSKTFGPKSAWNFYQSSARTRSKPDP